MAQAVVAEARSKIQWQRPATALIRLIVTGPFITVAYRFNNILYSQVETDCKPGAIIVPGHIVQFIGKYRLKLHFGKFVSGAYRNGRFEESITALVDAFVILVYQVAVLQVSISTVIVIQVRI